MPVCRKIKLIPARAFTQNPAEMAFTSHGLNRVERFVEYIGNDWVDVNAEPALDINLGAMEVYNGNMGPGVLNALFAMNRATGDRRKKWAWPGYA